MTQKTSLKGGNGGGSDRVPGYCFRCTRQVSSRKPCSTKYGANGRLAKAPSWDDDCPNKPRDAHG